jgi:hypothetical protein
MLLQDKFARNSRPPPPKPFITKITEELSSNALISVSIGIVFKFVLSDFPEFCY